MIFKKLGSNNILIPAIGFGCDIHSKASIDYNILNRLILESYNLGSIFFDTAPVYGSGESEKVVGQSIKGIRDKVFLSTKVSPKDTSFQGVINSLESSLKRLNTDYVDLYQVHWPNSDVPLLETISAMEKLVTDGKIRFIGVSNFTIKKIKESISCLNNNSLLSIQAEYNLFERSIEKDILPFAKSKNITIIAYSPLAQGKLANGSKQMSLINDLAKKYNARPGQIVLRFLIEKPGVVVIPNTSKINRLVENIQSADLYIDSEDLDRIDELCRTVISDVDTTQIRVSNEYNRKVYKTLEQAKQNKMGMVPSPVDLSEEMKLGEFLKPVRLRKLNEKKYGKMYDLTEGRLRYWAWIIAFGWDKPIPALVWFE